jgi:hypothetical protein
MFGKRAGTGKVPTLETEQVGAPVFSLSRAYMK